MIPRRCKDREVTLSLAIKLTIAVESSSDWIGTTTSIPPFAKAFTMCAGDTSNPSEFC